MKHLKIEQLEKYAARRLNSNEMADVLLHLDGCAACFESFQTMFPELSDAAREVSLNDLTADDAEVFHLDYDEHLRPFVDYEADEVTREIVESHLANCAFCARAVRELREFSDNLRLQQAAGKPKFYGAADYRSRRFTTADFWRLTIPAAAILTLVIGGWLVWRQSATTDFIAENQPPITAPSVAANENSFNRPPENSTAKPEIKLPVAPVENDLTNVNKKVGSDKNRESNQTNDEILPAALPPDFRAKFNNALRTQKINLPDFIAGLREKNNLRGETANEKNIIIAPDAQAERVLRPVFRWRQFGEKSAVFVVTVYDKDFNQIAVSPKLKNLSWRANVSLERGKIYQWQVAAENSAESYTARFKVLDENSIARLRKIENAAPNLPLVRGIGYASEGLLDDAAREFQKEIKKNPHGNTAGKLKDSIRRHR